MPDLEKSFFAYLTRIRVSALIKRWGKGISQAPQSNKQKDRNMTASTQINWTAINTGIKTLIRSWFPGTSNQALRRTLNKQASEFL